MQHTVGWGIGFGILFGTLIESETETVNGLGSDVINSQLMFAKRQVPKSRVLQYMRDSFNLNAYRLVSSFSFSIK